APPGNSDDGCVRPPLGDNPMTVKQAKGEPLMCGRVRLPEDYSEIKIDLKLHEVVPHTYTPRWNVPPTEMLPAITSKDGKRRLEPMRWGLIPSWAKDIKMGFSTFNARADAVASKPAFKGAWAKGRRCLIVTYGVY